MIRLSQPEICGTIGTSYIVSCLSKIEVSPQRRRGRRESIFYLAGDTAKQKGFRPFNASLIIGAIAIKRLRSSSRRPAYRQGVLIQSGLRRAVAALAAQAGDGDWIKRKPLSATSASLR